MPRLTSGVRLVCSPVFLGAFLCWTTMLEGKGIEGCREKIANDWFTMQAPAGATSACAPGIAKGWFGLRSYGCAFRPEASGGFW